MLGKGVGHPPFFSNGEQLNFRLDKRLQERFPRWFRSEGGSKGRNEYLKKQLEDMDKYFNDLLYSVCEGKVSEMTELKRFDVFDFFDYITNKEDGRRNTEAKS